jgi:predicted RNA-binding Zn-ribbon protein involved in translation (DUF1610 family)
VGPALLDIDPVVIYQSKDDSSFIEMIRNEEAQTLIFRLWKDKHQKAAELGPQEVFEFHFIYQLSKTQLQSSKQIPEFKSYGGRKYGTKVKFFLGGGFLSTSQKDEWKFSYKGRNIPLNEENIEILFQKLPYLCPQCRRWLQEKPTGRGRSKITYSCPNCKWQGDEEGLFRAQ